MPLVDRRVELHARIAADVGPLRDEAHEIACLVGVDDRSRRDGMRVPIAIVHHRAHEVIRHADTVVRVLEEHRGIRGPGERTVISGIDKGPGFLFFLNLAIDELDDIRLVGVEDYHLRGSAGLAAGLDDARKRVVALHEADGARRGASGGEKFSRRADRRQIGPGAGAELEQHAFGLGQRENRVHRVVDGIDEARRALGRFLEPAVEPDRAVERRFLVDEDVLQVVAEGAQVLIARKILLPAAPVRDGAYDAADELLDAVLTAGRANLTTEVLRRDDVGGLLRPGLRDLDVALLEDDLAAFVADDGVAQLPLHLIKGVNARGREKSRKSQAWARGTRLEGRSTLLTGLA